MERRCIICGRVYDLKNIPVWQKVALLNKKSTYVCDLCKAKVQYEAKEAQTPPKPM